MVYHPSATGNIPFVSGSLLCKTCALYWPAIRWGAALPSAFGLNRTRLELTGLEDPEELWDRLQEATAEAKMLSTANRKLVSRVRVLDRQLAEAGALSDDELVAELPKRMTRALESAQAVASEIVGRAEKRELVIRQKAEETSAEIVRHAERQAADIVARAQAEAASHRRSAEAAGADVLRAAHAQRQQILTEFEGESLALQERIALLRKDHARLVEAYDVVERSLGEARRVLGYGPPGPRAAPPLASAPPATPPRSRRPPPPRTRPGSSQPAGDPGGGAAAVYDWSPVASTAG